MRTFVLLLALALFAFPSTGANAGKEQDDNVSFAGTWKTIAGGTHQYTVTLKQVGNQVTGSYSPGNGKIFDGVVTGNKLTFKWTQDGGYEGTAEFRMYDDGEEVDGKGFAGFSHALKPTEFTVPWNTYTPPVTSFAGNWETISDGQFSIPLTIVQTGNKVTGLYPGNNGKIEGTVSGKVLRFKWESDGGSGSGRFVMDEGGQAFSGTYNRGDDPDEVEATWNGKHQAYTGGKGPPVSFAGEWAGAVGKDTLTWKLKQTGNQVTGQVQSSYKGFGIVLIRDGIVSGNTLRFKLDYSNGSGVSVEFVMDKGGKSFKGKIGVATTTATFVGP